MIHINPLDVRLLITLFSVTVFLLPEPTYGQTTDHQLDSLNRVVNASQGRAKMEAMFSIIRRHLNENLPMAYDVTRKAQDYAYQNSDSLMIVRVCHAWGIIYRKMDSLDRAESVLKIGISIAKRNKLNEYHAKLLNSLALIYYSRPDKAIECQQEAIRIHKEMGNRAELSICYNNLGLLFFKLNNFAEAKSYYQKSRSLKIALKDFYDLDILYVNMALSYNQLKRYDSAEYYIQQALAICKSPCNPVVLFNAELCRGVALSTRNQNDRALEHYYRALDISNGINESRPKIDILVSIGSIYIEQKKYHEAIEKLKLAEKTAMEAELKLSLVEIFKKLSLCYQKIEDSPHQAKYQLKFFQLKDSIYNEGLFNSLRAVSDSVSRGDTVLAAGGDENSKRLKRQNRIFLMITLLGVLMIGIAGYLYRKAVRQKSAVR